jgi:RNA polymerase sigma factor (sigma-70 family)
VARRVQVIDSHGNLLCELDAGIALRNGCIIREWREDEEPRPSSLDWWHGTHVYPNGFKQRTKRERRRQIELALMSLTSKQRYVMKLYYWRGLTFLEIAAAIGGTESNAAQIHWRGIATLREWFGARGIRSLRHI